MRANARRCSVASTTAMFMGTPVRPHTHSVSTALHSPIRFCPSNPTPVRSISLTTKIHDCFFFFQTSSPLKTEKQPSNFQREHEKEKREERRKIIKFPYRFPPRASPPPRAPRAPPRATAWARFSSPSSRCREINQSINREGASSGRGKKVARSTWKREEDARSFHHAEWSRDLPR